MPGPRPKPTRLKLLAGNPGHQKLNDREPQPTLGMPSCPLWLDAEAKAEWKRVAPELKRLGLLAKIDRAALASYCQAWAEFKIAKDELDEHGSRTITTKQGFMLSHPAVGRMKAAWQALRSFAAMFGFDPADRQALHVEPEQEADPFEELIKRGRKRKA